MLVTTIEVQQSFRVTGDGTVSRVFATPGFVTDIHGINAQLK